MIYERQNSCYVHQAKGKRPGWSPSVTHVIREPTTRGRAEMFELLKEHASEIISFLVGLGGGSLLTLRFTRHQRVEGQGSISDQRSARAGGDIVGRDRVSTERPPTKGR
jgi:hypothetical protein